MEPLEEDLGALEVALSDAQMAWLNAPLEGGA